ncbi:MAG: peptide chain release factor N(5)-glutamine methyltransferase [Pseudomonadota bacterium]
MKQQSNSTPHTATVLQVLRAGEEELSKSSSSSRIDSEVLLRHVLNVSQSGLIIAFPEPCPVEAQARFSELIARRKKGEPIAYILGEREFWGLPFRVNPDVLVPRPESELLVEETLKRCKQHKSVNLLDMGTGSGCIAIAIVKGLLERGCSDVTCDALDISAAALAVARGNSERHGVSVNIRFIHGSWSGDLAKLRPPYDCIVANPPYIDCSEKTPVELSYEPRSALYSDGHGLADTGEILRSGLPLLKPGGVLLCEVGAGKGPWIEKLMEGYRGNYKIDYLGDSSEQDRFRVVRVQGR